MAKKKQELTVEEKLAAALVREDEQPYGVPGNWVWTRLGSVAKFVGGGTPSKSNTSYWNGTIPWASVKDIKGDILYLTIDKITEEGVQNSSTNVCEVGDLLLVTRIEPGKSIISNIKTAVNQDLKIVKSPLSSNFLHYFMLTRKDEFIANASGSTVLGISIQNVKEIKFPLPPLAEQQRIVDRIESLFDQLDQAKALIQEVLDSFETRKAAILHQAFTGVLTKKWREEHGVGMESWEETSLVEQTSLIGDGLHGTPIYNDQGVYYFINGNNLNGFDIIIKPETKRIDFTEYEKYKKKLNDKTVLVSINGTLGKTGFYNNEPIILGKSACYFNVENSLDKFFIRYYLETKEFINYANIMATGSTIKNLSLKSIRNMPINLPSLPEQQEIVRILDDLFAKEQAAFDLCDLIDQIDTIKKTILGKAFRGELGTNVAGEESAVELLKSIS